MRWHRKVFLLALASRDRAPRQRAMGGGASNISTISARDSRAHVDAGTRSSTTTSTASTGAVRNELRFDLKYDLIQEGTGGDLGPIKTLKFQHPVARALTIRSTSSATRTRPADYDRGNFEFRKARHARAVLRHRLRRRASEPLAAYRQAEVVWGGPTSSARSTS